MENFILEFSYFVFNVILKGKENILSQSSSNALVLNISLYFFIEVGLEAMKY